MTDQTSICNKALRKIGVKSIMNINTDDSVQASECKAVYDDILLELLRTYDWSFATFRQSLNKDNTDPVFGFENRFILPTIPQFVKLISIENNPEFKVENNFILSNEDTMNIVFIGKETDVSKYDSIFIDLFAIRIALEVSYKLTSDFNIVNRMQAEYLNMLSLAKDRNFQENNQRIITSSKFNNARVTGLLNSNDGLSDLNFA